ncbi:MAG: hypothetical protein KME30_07235 [Iphinoe sp. HA4291-MV1]|nr:hypothetical protein [Iphinoe sp. HA4291-MV1]
MKQVFTAKEKLIATSERENLLQEVTLVDQSCLNCILGVAFEKSKLFLDMRLQKYLALSQSEKEVLHKVSRRERYTKKTPQQKGIFFVQPRLMVFFGRGKQFTIKINDYITKQIVTYKNFIILEKLTLYLRIFPNYLSREIYNSRVQRTSNRRRCCHLYPVSYDQEPRKANVSQSKWSYAELDGFINSKVVMNTSSARKVDTDYCNQFHPCYGHTNKHNCPNQGLTVPCSKSHGFELCADSVGGRNITMRTLLLWQDCCSRRLVVTAYPPKVSLLWGNNTIVSPLRGDGRGVYRNCETKIERLSSFLKLGGV